MDMDKNTIRRWARICENLGTPDELRKLNGRFVGADSSYQDSRIVLLGVPYDATVTYKTGAAGGPDALRRESDGAIETWSPYQNMDLGAAKVHDAGNLDVLGMPPDEMVWTVESSVARILSDGKIPFLVGGEHLVTLGGVRAAARKYPGLHLLHFDAHADLADEHEGQSLSHATVMRRCHDILGDGRIFQFGIRSGSEDEFEFIKAGHVKTEMFQMDSVPRVQVPEGAPVYLTVDLDVLDPSELPGTGTPEAGGVGFADLLSKLVYVLRTMNVVAVDNMELAPSLDGSGISTALACKLLREEILAAARGLSWGNSK